MRRLDVNQDYGENTLTVGPGTSIGQTFKALHNNLAGVRFGVSNTKLGGSGEYEFTILDEKQTILQTLTVKESNLGWQNIFRYDFAPIADSAGKTYTLNLSYLGSSSSAENKEKVLVAYSEKDLYKDGAALVNKKEVSGDLTFSTYYQVNPGIFLRDSASDFVTRLSSDTAFLYSYVALLTIFSIYLLRQLLSKRRV